MRVLSFSRRSSYSTAIPLLFIFIALLAISWLPSSSAVRSGDFKKCKDSSFCRRLRRLSSYVANQTSTFESPYSIPTSSPVQFDVKSASLTFPIKSALHPEIDFEVRFVFQQDGTARVLMDQVGERYGGWKRYNEAASWAYQKELIPASDDSVKVTEKKGMTLVSYGPQGQSSLELKHSPFKATFLRNGEPQMILNDRGLLHMEHFRAKEEDKKDVEEESKDKSTEQDGNKLVFQKRQGLRSAGHTSAQIEAWAGFEEHDSGEWTETWASRLDTKPKGPEALSIDITFPGKRHLFGLPEHASPLNLKSTKGEAPGDFTDPYRLMNTDVFEYEHDSPMSLYGSVPILHAQSSTKGAASVFFLSGAETWIDINRKGDASQTHWMAESGILDLLVLLEDTPGKNIERFTDLVGRTTAPQTFALGYHQCRWNYLSDSDVLNVQAKFDEEDIPMDVMWLDIEYSKDHMYGVWEDLNFPNPEAMIDGLDANGRKLVIIIDPHLKRTSSYWLYKEAQSHEVLVKTADGSDEYEGWCWSGSASWLDMFNPKATAWWKSQYTLDSKNQGPIRANRRNMHIWNDMNEPAIFNGPEVTSPKDVIHHGGWEHRDIHNINGVLFQAATFLGLKEREGAGLELERRPFVLARSWWVGTQRFGAVWTGDNLGTWEHLAVSVPMILANNVAGMSFCGADIGGFFGNPSPEMLVRWYQAGIFEPFFRAHAHIDTKRREPYLLEEPHRSAVRELIRLRYQMLPIWMTAFKEAGDEGSGLSVLRPQFVVFPQDEQGLDIDDQYYLGDSGLLVKPAVAEGAASVSIYLSDARPYYNYFTHQVYRRSESTHKNGSVEVEAPLLEGAKMPLLIRGGSILPIRERVRRSAELGWKDPVTLIIALDASNEGEKQADGSISRGTGVLYLDDGQTYHYKRGAYLWRRFNFFTSADSKKHTIKSQDEAALRRSAGDASSSTQAVSSSAESIAPYDSKNEFAEAIKDVRIEKIVILGLGEKQDYSIRVVDGEVVAGGASSKEEDLSYRSEAGVSADDGKKKKEKISSRLTIKDPRVAVRSDWEIEIVQK